MNDFAGTDITPGGTSRFSVMGDGNEASRENDPDHR